MIRKILYLCLISFFAKGYSQDIRPIAQKILDQHQKKSDFKSFSVLQPNFNSDKKAEYKRSATDITVLSLNESELKKIVKDQPENITLSIPFRDTDKITIELTKNKIFTEDFKVTTSNGFVANYTPGVYYHGIVKGDYTSVVAFSFFENDIVGVASTNNLGNVIVGKAKNSNDFVSYSDSALTGVNSFICEADELLENQKQKINYDPSALNQKTLTANCVRVYYEVCYTPYTNNNSNVTTTTNWLTAIHNNIATLYNNDNINVALSEIFIWQTQDPYTGTYSQNLSAFRATRTTFNGDLAHMVNSPSTTSVAYLNSLCTSSRYAYSGINQTYNNVPVYSWTIMAMTHEMGHALGSPHTHACAWNGNGTAIDGCGPQAGQNEGCTGPIPSTTVKGTIMSYCHLISGVGINFTNGFGPQPAALIRNTVESKACLGTNCTTACTTTVTSLAINNIGQTTATAVFADNTSSAWKYRIARLDGTVVATGNLSTNTFAMTGLQPGTYYNFSVGTSCSGPDAYQRTQMFLTDADWCNDYTFTDTGGAAGNYANSQTITKTFYPTSGSVISMSFTDFDLELDYDYMYIYNGPTATASMLFPNGTLTGSTLPGTYTSTHSSGAITVRFVSDAGVVGRGWSANFSCNVLGTAETNIKNNSISIYPNPVKNVMNISSKSSLKSFKIFDEAGRLILEDNKLSGNQLEINVSTLLKGNYVISLETQNESFTKKFIKH